ncbi:MAG TPA: tetratricopeptide repeat protein, partial [Cyclobacteriaceae bacterium]|nr:tetratricopeptide repeat protein [Cyclobacteriaceae bacterium]
MVENLDEEIELYLQSRNRFEQYYMTLPILGDISMDSLEVELPNLQKALSWVVSGGNKGLIPGFWGGVKDLLMQRGYWDAFLDWGKIVLQTYTELNNDWDAAWLLSDFGWLEMEFSEFSKAQDYFEKAKTIFYSMNDHSNSIEVQRARCVVERYLGVLAYRREDYAKASEYYSRSLNIAVSYKFSGSVSETYNLLG